MKSNLYTIVYSLAMAAVSALLLTAADTVASPYRKANMRAEQVRSVLDALEVPFDAGASSQQLVTIYEEDVRKVERGGLTIYEYAPEGDQEPRTLAVYFEGPGVWGPIEGYLALEPDMRTVKGVIFQRQEETPGLGGEIASEAFRSQFKGRSIVDASGKPGMRIVKGGSSGAANEVDAVTGATMTSGKVEALLNAAIEEIIKEGGDVR